MTPFELLSYFVTSSVHDPNFLLVHLRSTYTLVGRLTERTHPTLPYVPSRFYTAPLILPSSITKVHHVLKAHPYRKLALSLRSTEAQGSILPRVIGLTASFTYAVGKKKVKASLEALCRELHLTQCESATPEELRSSGYFAASVEANLSLPPVDISASSMVTGVVPESDRKPHMMGRMFFSRENAGRNTAFTTRLMACVRAMETAIAKSSEVESFTSPLPPSGMFAVSEWSAYVHKLACNGNCDSGSFAPTANATTSKTHARPMLAEMEFWYEAVKALVVSWEQDVDTAVTILNLGGYGQSRKNAGGEWPPYVHQLMSSFWREVPANFPRFENLKQVLLAEYERYGGDGNSASGSSFRGIVFVQQRVTTHVLEYVIASDPDLALRFTTACLYASSSRATPSLSVSKNSSEMNLQLFREGLVNLLITTVVAEEGMDVPMSNCVIRFDPMHHAVSLVQGRGRARKEGSSHVVLAERRDRPIRLLEHEAQQQLKFFNGFTPPDEGATVANNATILAAQRSRECRARSALLKVQATTFGALSAVKIFAMQTKVDLDERMNKVASGQWRCTLIYESPLRNLCAAGEAPGKKIARKLAAAKLVQDLLAVVPAS